MSNTNKFSRWILMGGIGLGAGAIAAYLSDPKQGPIRRAKLVKGAGRLWQRTTGEVKKSLVDAQHHLAGVSARFYSSLRVEEPPGQVLEARIRSRIGRVLPHPRKVHVICDHGLVTLWGTVPQDEIYRLLRVVKAVPGVKDIQEHLETCELEERSKEDFDPLSHARKAGKLHWSPSKRMLVGTTGVALALYGLKRREEAGKAATVLGAGLLAYSMMPNDLSSTLALTEDSPGFELEKTIKINAPLSDVFDFWANPENYPRAFSHVSGIERLGENLYLWRLIGPSKVAVTWEGVITRVIPNTLIEWKSLPGSSVGNFGAARFDPIYDGSTRVHIRMFYRPPAGILGRFVAEFLGADPSKILDQDLNQLKQLFESGGMSTKSSSRAISIKTEAREAIITR